MPALSLSVQSMTILISLSAYPDSIYHSDDQNPFRNILIWICLPINSFRNASPSPCADCSTPTPSTFWYRMAIMRAFLFEEMFSCFGMVDSVMTRLAMLMLRRNLAVVGALGMFKYLAWASLRKDDQNWSKYRIIPWSDRRTVLMASAHRCGYVLRHHPVTCTARHSGRAPPICHDVFQGASEQAHKEPHLGVPMHPLQCVQSKTPQFFQISFFHLHPGLLRNLSHLELEMQRLEWHQEE